MIYNAARRSEMMFAVIIDVDEKKTNLCDKALELGIGRFHGNHSNKSIATWIAFNDAPKLLATWRDEWSAKQNQSTRCC